MLETDIESSIRITEIRWAIEDMVARNNRMYPEELIESEILAPLGEGMSGNVDVDAMLLNAAIFDRDEFECFIVYSAGLYKKYAGDRVELFHRIHDMALRRKVDESWIKLLNTAALEEMGESVRDIIDS